MARKTVRIQRDLYKKDSYQTAFDTEFETYALPVEEVNTDTVEELFRLYDKLYYSVPIEGEDNSHEYILRRSSEIATFDKTSEEIQPLLDEIAQLRAVFFSSPEQMWSLDPPFSFCYTHVSLRFMERVSGLFSWLQ